MKFLKVFLFGGLLAASLVAATPLEDPPVFELQWGSWGTQPGQFRFPHGVATDDLSYVYVADTGNDRIQVFSSNGVLVGSWTRSGLTSPRGIAVSAARRIYVIEDNTVEVYGFPGVFLGYWGGAGEGPGQFDTAYGIAVDDSEYVYVADTFNSRIQKFRSDGTLITYWETDRNPTGIAIDSHRHVYVVDRLAGRVQKFDSDGTFLTAWSTGLVVPVYIAIDGADNVYITDSYLNKCFKFTPDGLPILQWGSTGAGEGQFQGPSGIAVDRSGSIFVADGWAAPERARIQKFSPAPTSTSSGSWGSLKARYR